MSERDYILLCIGSIIRVERNPFYQMCQAVRIMALESLGLEL